MIIRVEILVEGEYLVVNFLDRNENKDLVFINNSEFDIKLFQKGYREEWVHNLKQRDELAFGFINPYGK